MMKTLTGTIMVAVMLGGVHHLSHAQYRSSRSTAMGGASVAITADAWAGYANPARLAQAKHLEVSTILIPELFGLKELRTVGVGALMPVGPVVAGLNAYQFGFELYKETGVTASLAGELDWDVSGGIAVHMNRFSIARYGSTTKILVDGGLHAAPLKDLRLGFAMKNIAGASIGSHGERLPRLFSFGTAYSPTASFVVTVEVEKDVRYPLSLRAGVEQRLLNVVSIRLGTSSKPDIFSGGIGVSYSMFDFGYAGFHHPDLGWTHQIELGFALGR